MGSGFLALLTAGLRSVGACEILPRSAALRNALVAAANSVAGNVNHAFTDVADMRDQRPGDIYRADVSIVTSECVAFSTLGKGGGLECDKGDLALHCLKLAMARTDNFILFETVEGACTTPRGGRGGEGGGAGGGAGALGGGASAALPQRSQGVKRSRAAVAASEEDAPPSASVAPSSSAPRATACGATVNPPSQSSEAGAALGAGEAPRCCDGGTPNKGSVLEGLLEYLHDGGFHTRWACINAVECGLPVSRPRVYIIASRSPSDVAAFQWPVVVPVEVTSHSLMSSCVDERFFKLGKIDDGRWRIVTACEIARAMGWSEPAIRVIMDAAAAYEDEYGKGAPKHAPMSDRAVRVMLGGALAVGVVAQILAGLADVMRARA